MSRWIKETGFLNEVGEAAVMDFKIALNRLLLQPDVQVMSEGELRTLGCVLHNLVGNTMFDHIRKNSTGS